MCTISSQFWYFGNHVNGIKLSSACTAMTSALMFSQAKYSFSCIEDFFNETVTCYLKNHWTKHRLVCINFDVFSMLVLNVGIILYKFYFIFSKSGDDCGRQSTSSHRALAEEKMFPRRGTYYGFYRLQLM